MNFLVHELSVGRGVPHLQEPSASSGTAGHHQVFSASLTSQIILLLIRNNAGLSTARGEQLTATTHPIVPNPSNSSGQMGTQEVHLPRHTACFRLPFFKKIVFVIRTTSQEVIFMSLHLNKTQPLLMFLSVFKQGCSQSCNHSSSHPHQLSPRASRCCPALPGLLPPPCICSMSGSSSSPWLLNTGVSQNLVQVQGLLHFYKGGHIHFQPILC